jgi:hypothetical protein
MKYNRFKESLMKLSIKKPKIADVFLSLIKLFKEFKYLTYNSLHKNTFYRCAYDLLVSGGAGIPHSLYVSPTINCIILKYEQFIEKSSYNQKGHRREIFHLALPSCFVGPQNDWNEDRNR